MEPTNQRQQQRRPRTMSSDKKISSGDSQVDEESSVSTAADDGLLLESEERSMLTLNVILCEAIQRGDVETVQQAIRNGANVDAVHYNNIIQLEATPLIEACGLGYDEIIRILLDAGADARWRNPSGSSAITEACFYGHLSAVQLLFNHDSSLLELANIIGRTPLVFAIGRRYPDIVRFLLDSGANAQPVDRYGVTTLMHACDESKLEIVQLLLAAGVDVEARDRRQQTALHHAAFNGAIETVRELILQHNANMFDVDRDGSTPFDLACSSSRRAAANPLLEIYGNKLTQEHDRIALHELLKVAQYSFIENDWFHPPLNPLKIILPIGKLTLQHLCTVLHNLDPELIRNRDDAGKLPIHIACQTNTPVELLSMLVEIDSATLQIADNHSSSLPIHSCFSGMVEYSSVRYLVEQGGVGTLAARNHEGALPLHVLCGSTNPPLRAVQYLIQSFPGSMVVQTNAGQYPFMVAASNSSASLNVLYELVRANPGLVIPT